MRIITLKMGELDKGIYHYNYLKNNRPDLEEDISLKLGLIYYDKKEFNKAINHFENTIQINSKNYYAHYYLALLNETLENYTKAIHSFQ